MNLQTLEMSVWVPAPLEKVWEFFCFPENLIKVTPHPFELKSSYEGLSSQNKMQEGAKVLLSFAPVKGLSCTLKWDLIFKRIEESPDQCSFIDEQLKGPFQYWRHEHIFERGSSEVTGMRSNTLGKIKIPGTWIRDFLQFNGPVGGKIPLADYIIRKQLLNLFHFRAQKQREIFDL